MFVKDFGPGRSEINNVVCSCCGSAVGDSVHYENVGYVVIEATQASNAIDNELFFIEDVLLPDGTYLVIKGCLDETVPVPEDDEE